MTLLGFTKAAAIRRRMRSFEVIIPSSADDSGSEKTSIFDISMCQVSYASVIGKGLLDNTMKAASQPLNRLVESSF